MIRFWCQCGRQLQAKESNIGQPAQCPLCHHVTTVPDEDEKPPTSAPAPPRRINEYGEITRDEPAADRVERPPLSRPRVDDWDEDYSPRRRGRGAFSRPAETCKDAQTALTLR